MATDSAAAAKPRLYAFDNIRFILMYLVIFGHILAYSQTYPTMLVYKVVYLFHMPAFLFLTGYFAKFNPKRMLTKILLPYLIFQTLYLLFAHFVLGNGGGGFSLQYTTPYWIMWYMLATFLFTLLVPFIETDSKKKMLVVFIISVVIALVAGYDETLGYYLSLSRLCVFAPFFIGGFYAKRLGWFDKIRETKGRRGIATIIGLAGATLGVVYVVKAWPADRLLYGSVPYSTLNTTPIDRIIVMVLAMCWILLLIAAMTNRKIPVISVLGGATLYIYLFHGFAVRGIFGPLTNAYPALAVLKQPVPSIVFAAIFGLVFYIVVGLIVQAVTKARSQAKEKRAA